MIKLSDDNKVQSISDDQELAKALAGVTDDVDALTKEDTAASVNYGQDLPQINNPDPVAMPDPIDSPITTASPSPVADYSQGANQPAVDPQLAGIKQTVLEELRPLVDKLEVSPEEKFNTYLLLIRSTDDRDLIAPAHQTAKLITDESKRAQALLDIVREIDYLSHPQR